MPSCHNCGNADRFALLVEFALPYPDGDPATVATSLQCAECESTDVAGEPAALLADYASR